MSPSPTGSQPQTCLAPQYHPSQLSGLRAWNVKPPRMDMRRIWQPCVAWTVFVSPWPSPWQNTA